MECEVTKVSTLEEELVNLRQLPQPVGIMVFGVDGDFKKEVIGKMERCLGEGFSFLNGLQYDSDLMATFINSYGAAVMLNSEKSAMHEIRHALVYQMIRTGARSVAGVYIKTNSAMETARVNKWAIAVENSNPNADGLDYFIVVREREG